MKLYFKNFEIYHNNAIYSQLPPIYTRPRSPWEVHAEPLGLRGAQVGNLCCRVNAAKRYGEKKGDAKWGKGK